jgi:hypothetical protein
VPPDNVWCTREFHSKLATFGNSGRPLRYNSPDCPVCQAEQRSSAPTVVCNATVNSEKCTYARRSQSRRQKAQRTVNRTCPVHHQTIRWPRCQKLQRSEPNSLVMWLAHRTVWCAIRQKPSPTVILVVGAINTPPTTTLQYIQVFSHQTSYKSSRLHSKTQTKRSNPLPSPELLQTN